MTGYSPPLRFAFGVHLHQPVGNFDSVFRQHLDQVYRPFLNLVTEREFFPIVLHLSGPLLEWLEQHGGEYLDQVGRLVADGRIELLLAGFYEPILAALPRDDRREQIALMRDALEKRFGFSAAGLWLTERIWEPELAADLADAGVAYALVDDRHFLAAGFEREQLHQPWHTESDGRGLDLFAIDERLRYLIPFRPPGEAVQYFRELRERGHGLAVLADDGEKFGGWPGTRELVYDRGWLLDFLGAMERLIAGGEVRLVTFQQALAEMPAGGLAYLPTASYREMESWSLPNSAARRLQSLEAELGEERLRGPDGALVRGSHWRNFLVKYPESNRMQKKASALSRLCRARGNPVEARRAISRSQCNDAWWHGVFGGLYLPHLRHAVWQELARAEGLLRHDESLEWEVVDADADGHDEILIHSSAFSAAISPRRGGALEEYTTFSTGLNYADALTRRREPYHRVEEANAPEDHAGTPSIHEIQSAARLKELPPADRHPRALFVDRISLPDGLDSSPGAVDPWWDGATAARHAAVEYEEEILTITLTTSVDSAVRVVKQYRFARDGLLQVSADWHAPDAPPSARFAFELSLGHPLALTCSPGVEIVRYPITTVSMSERGFDSTVQGEAVVVAWPMESGRGEIGIGSR